MYYNIIIWNGVFVYFFFLRKYYIIRFRRDFYMKLNTTKTTSAHNVGIDLLRIVSMYLVVLLHVLGVGGILDNLGEPYTNQYRFAWLLEIGAYCAVNCYALISGYVGVHSRFRISRLAQLWLQIVFYTLIITAIFAICQPGTITLQYWINALFPIVHDQYWYLTSYFGMCLFVPLMNLALNSFSKKQLTAMVLAIFVFFITIPTIIQLDPFMLTNGYSMIWLCILYIVGGYLKKYDVMAQVRPLWGLLAYIVAVLVTLLLQCTGYTHFVSYTSPTIFIAGLGLLVFFGNLKINGAFFKKAIALLAPATLGVYIIHVNPLIFWRLLADSTIPFLGYKTVIMVPMVLATALGIYAVCTIIDLVRIFIFKKLGVKEKTALLDGLWERYLG